MKNPRIRHTAANHDIFTQKGVRFLHHYTLLTTPPRTDTEVLGPRGIIMLFRR